VARRRPLEDPQTLRVFFDQLKEGIYVSTVAGRILDANPAMLEILGVSSLDELQQVSAAELFVDPERRLAEIELLRRQGWFRDFELELRRPDGTIRTVLDSCFGVRDPDTRELRFHGILVDITQRKELEARLREASRRDSLTGVYNRRYLVELVEHLETRAAGWGLVVLDINHFKLYNDQHGHLVGDDVLRTTTAFLLDVARDEDRVIRLGGDEFLIVLSREGWTQAPEVAQRLQSEAQRRELPVTFTLGWAVREGDERFEQTLTRADAMVLSSRRSGRRRRPPSVPHPFRDG
jgi:diguanylate cyclase (GGDEF)-like protein/PAS domain S-box-containing protein